MPVEKNCVWFSVEGIAFFHCLVFLSCLAHLCSSFLCKKKTMKHFRRNIKHAGKYRTEQNRTDLFSTSKIKQMLTFFSTAWSLFYRHKMLHRYILAPCCFSHHPSAEEKTYLKLLLYHFFACLYFCYVSMCSWTLCTIILFNNYACH